MITKLVQVEAMKARAIRRQCVHSSLDAHLVVAGLGEG